MEIDWAAVRRARKDMGDEQCLLLLKTRKRYHGAVLDDAVPPDDGDGPANGGWFETPQGWMLFIEGLGSEVDPWIERLAAGLEAAGVAGVIGGGRTVGPPAWERHLRFAPALVLNFGFAPYAHQQGSEGPGWETHTLTQAATLGTDWLVADGGNLRATVDLQASFFCDVDTAVRILTSEVGAHHRPGLADSFHDSHQEIRTCDLQPHCRGSLATRSAGYDWQKSVDDLKVALLALPKQRLSMAMISHLDWTGYLRAQPPGSEHYCASTFAYYPERWSEFTLDPCGIQILTDRHLAKAHSLDAWRTTKLDETHYLVEARELAAWYATPLAMMDPVPAEVLDPARADFGDLVITHERAHELGIDRKPPRRG